MDKEVLLSGISGFPEYLPAEQAIFDRMLSIIEEGFKVFGFQHLETPAVERKEILTAKGGNDKEIYALSRLAAALDEDPDTGMALHFDLTVPLARFVAVQWRHLAFPFRRYQIQKVWRGERAQVGKGRYREFYQCDIDIIGKGKLSLVADAEVPCVISQIFEKLTTEFNLGDFVIRINNRRIVQGYMESLGIPADRISPVLSILDGLEKTDPDKLRQELVEVGLSLDQISEARAFCAIRGSCDDVLGKLRAMTVDHDGFKQGLADLGEVVLNIQEMRPGAVPRFAIDLGVIRGLDYYTGTIYETQLTSHLHLGSVCSGGRYENLAGYFTDEQLPGVGISIGATRLFGSLLEEGALKAATGIRTVLVTAMDPTLRKDYYALADELRSAGIPSEVYLEGKKLGAQLEYANRKGHAVCLVMGTNEAATQTVQIKQMKTGTSTTCQRADLIAAVRAAL